VKVKLQSTPWAGILAALESKRLDVVINQVTISEERKKKYDFSEPYTVSGIQALVQKKDADKFKTAADLKGAKVGVGLGTNYEQWLKENVPGAIVKTYDDDPTKYQDLRVGRIDAILVDRLAALELLSKTKDQLAISGEPFSRQESGIALRKGEPELLAAINKAIDKLRADGTLAKLSQKYFNADVTK
jgi:cystine transport system substrate-binding protein